MALVLEDDVILCRDFWIKLNTVVDQFKGKFDFLFIDAGNDDHIGDGTMLAYPSERSRSTGAYVVTKDAAQRYHGHITRSGWCHAVDWQMIHDREQMGFRYFWAEPPLTIQGSIFGLMTSQKPSNPEDASSLVKLIL